jgi:hypothetical protein
VCNYENCNLWRRTLAEQCNDLVSEERSRLRSTYLQLRERAGLLAGEINRELPDFTVHDLSHLDALWQMADLIAGPTVQMNPLEAFVLGSSFLLHDLGLGLAAYPEGKESLEKDPLWSDSLSTLLRKQLGRPPTRQEMDTASSSIKMEATANVLRLRHAGRAEQLFGTRCCVSTRSGR